MGKRLLSSTIVAMALSFNVLFLGNSCSKEENFKILSGSCATNLDKNVTIREVKNIYQGEVIEITKDWTLEGYIISSDKEGNFFNSLHFQDSPSNPEEGLQIDIDIRDSHLLYEVGNKIYIKLKGLYLGESKGVLKLGGANTLFGNLTISRLPVLSVKNHIWVDCEDRKSVV